MWEALATFILVLMLGKALWPGSDGGYRDR